MARIWATLIGYVFGNFLTAMIVGKIFLKINPTEYGSHNPGTANMGAVFGKKWGILTCLGDLFLKRFCQRSSPLRNFQKRSQSE